MATMRPPNAAVPRWKIIVFPTDETTVNDPTDPLLLAKYQDETDIAITICTRKERDVCAEKAAALVKGGKGYAGDGQ